MSSSQFRAIAPHGGKPERLFRAAVEAFCSLTRPSRREIAQLDDLALPLFGSVSTDSLRYAAAALSEVRHAPPALVRRLANEPADIAAPLLIRSRALSDVDLVALIGRHGLPHARAIARREGLHPRISELVRAIGADRALTDATSEREIAVPHDAPASAEQTREFLRAMMEPVDQQAATEPVARTSRSNEAPAPFQKLLSTALTGVPAFYQTTLADLLDMDMAQARALTASPDSESLPRALNALGLSADQAFLIASCIAPSRFQHVEAIRAFLDTYAAIAGEDEAEILVSSTTRHADNEQQQERLQGVSGTISSSSA